MKLNAFVILAALTPFAALATEPAAAPAAPAVAAAPAAAAIPASISLAANMSAEERASVTKWARMQGYKPELKKGGTIWCKNEATIGERIPRTKCATEESLAEMQKASIATKETLGEKMRTCAGQTCLSN